MGPILVQNTAGKVTVLLTLKEGGPATGLTSSAITVSLRKEGQSSYTAITLTPDSLVEIGSGVYDFNLLAGELNVVGNFTLLFAGSVVATQLVTAYVTDALPVNPGAVSVPLGTAGIYGYLKDTQGRPVPYADVFVRVVGIPVTTTQIGYSIASQKVKSDADGYFFLTLVTDLTVNITIPAVNFSRTFIVPSSNANLFGIP